MQKIYAPVELYGYQNSGAVYSNDKNIWLTMFLWFENDKIWDKKFGNHNWRYQIV